MLVWEGAEAIDELGGVFEAPVDGISSLSCGEGEDESGRLELNRLLSWPTELEDANVTFFSA